MHPYDRRLRPALVVLTMAVILFLAAKPAFPAGKLRVDGDAAVAGNMSVGGKPGQYRFQLPNMSGFGGQARANGWMTYSSVRWKENIKPIGNALAKVLSMRGVYFDWKQQYGGRHDIGFVAEEVGAIVPELVDWEGDTSNALGMRYDRMTALLLEAAKDQQKEVDSQQDHLELLDGQVSRIDEVNQTQDQQITTLTTQLKEQQAKIDAQQVRITQLESDNKAIHAELEQLKALVAQLQAAVAAAGK